jgi:triosephosphate isomerase
MNLDHVEAIHLVQQLGVLLRAHSHDHVDVMVLPPSVDLRSVTSVIDADRLPIQVGAQHVSQHERGAYTGEISAAMLRRLGVGAVLVGHSERRQLFAMDEDTVAATFGAVQRASLRPILCVGETDEVRRGGEQVAYVTEQLDRAMVGALDTAFVVAYEPIWAIGTGVSAQVEEIEEMAVTIRRALPEARRTDTAVLYGGSVTADNVAEIARRGRVDGFLVGGASLRAEEFVAIVAQAHDCYGGTR